MCGIMHQATWITTDKYWELQHSRSTGTYLFLATEYSLCQLNETSSTALQVLYAKFVLWNSRLLIAQLASNKIELTPDWRTEIKCHIDSNFNAHAFLVISDVLCMA